MKELTVNERAKQEALKPEKEKVIGLIHEAKALLDIHLADVPLETLRSHPHLLDKARMSLIIACLVEDLEYYIKKIEDL